MDEVSSSIVKMLKQLFQSLKVSFVMSAIIALDEQNVLDWLSQIPEIFSNINYQEEIARMHVRVQHLDFDSYCLLNFPKRSFKMKTRWKCTGGNVSSGNAFRKALIP
ncbi:superkiller-like protein [Trifolium medium]|uniref:Superkiller-like protein n=1 Tax=Trifolium medium TaxID=97028 RepID=A0A392MUE4_9FABA|nr:superkiller-like protein [Trifolium medium]